MYYLSYLLVQVSRFAVQALVCNLFLVLGKIMPAAVDGYEHAVAHTSYSLLWGKGYDAAVELADIVETACGSIHPPHIFPIARHLAKVYLHGHTVVVVHHQVILATGGKQTVIAFAIPAHNDALVGHPLEIRHGEHQVLEMLHLIEARVIKSLIPSFLQAADAITRGITRLQHLHDGVMTIGVTTRASKNTPIGIATHIVVLPALFTRIV